MSMRQVRLEFVIQTGMTDDDLDEFIDAMSSDINLHLVGDEEVLGHDITDLTKLRPEDRERLTELFFKGRDAAQGGTS